MGQEILYCHKCGKRLVGDDFTRGRAHTFNNLQYCATCVPQSISSGAQAALKDPRPVERPQAVSQARPKPVKPATARVIPASRPASSATILVLGLAIIAAVVVIIYVVRTSGNSDPAPEPVIAKPPPAVVAAQKPEPPKPAPPIVSKEKIAKDLQDLEAKIQPTVKKDQFSAAIDLLEEARKRFDAPEWTQGVARLIKEAQDKATVLYGPLKEQACNAQLRGALAEVQQVRTRLVGWGRKELLDDFDKAVAVIVPHEPLPPGATVLALFPNGDMSRYRYFGEPKNGALNGLDLFGGHVVGIEKGAEIFKVPGEGEVRVTFSTNSSKPITLVVRAIGPDGKSHPHIQPVPSGEAGRPQVFKVTFSALKDVHNLPIRTGAVVDNVYFRQDDLSAALTVYEFVIFKTKD